MATPRMAEPVEGQCLYTDPETGERCTTEAVIGNPDWITGITGLPREEICYCDDHLGALVEAAGTIDLTPGGGSGASVGHTRSTDFEEQDSGFGDLGGDGE